MKLITLLLLVLSLSTFAQKKKPATPTEVPLKLDTVILDSACATKTLNKLYNYAYDHNLGVKDFKIFEAVLQSFIIEEQKKWKTK